MSRFAPVPSSPNCVSSRAPVDDRQHYIAPLQGVTLEQVKAAALAMPRTTVLEQSESYVHLVCATAILRFKDDVELEAEGDVVHVRSASRVGYGDLGVNRKRIEALRKALTEQ
jgi:uncharacterized protein (DUF1499 family)